jgi:DNA uptake protein ComE-like DNA-binding protein
MMPPQGLPGPPPGADDPPADLARGGRVRDRLRQLAWASVPVWSLGLLAFAPFLRLALARRRTRDWAVFAGYLAAVILELVLLTVSGSSGGTDTFAGGVIIALMGGATVHTLVAFRPGHAPPPAGPPPSPAVSSLRPNQQALADAEARIQRRAEARERARTNPALARELRIGRPDLPREYDDGGLVDVNHVPGEILASHLGLTPQETAAVVAARDQLGKFASPEELSVYAQLPPDRVDELRDLMWFG